MLLLLSLSAALAGPSVTIASVTHGGELHDATPGFDPLTGLLEVTGTVSGLDPWSSDHTVGINEVTVPLAADGDGVAGFAVEVDMRMGVSLRRPLDDWFHEPRWMYRPVSAVVFAPGLPWTVLARDRVLLYDDRGDVTDQLRFHEPTGVVMEGMQAQLTATGVEALGPALADLLPQPDVDAWEADLASEVALSFPVFADADDPEVRCVSLSALDLDWMLTDAYLTAYAEALLQWALYEAAEIASETPACSSDPACLLIQEGIMAAQCVRHVPLPGDDFEVCVQSTALPLAHVDAPFDDADLALVVDELVSEVTLAPVHAIGDLRLEGLSVRWTERPLGCLSRPEGMLSDADEADPFVEAWRTCEDVALDAPSARGKASLVPAIDAVDDEAVDVGTTEALSFRLDGPAVGPLTGTCTEPAIVSLATETVLALIPAVEDVLSGAWNRGVPDNGHADAADVLFDEFELGRVPLPDHDLVAPLALLEVDGIVDFSWLTDADPLVGLDHPTWFRPVGTRPIASVDGLDPDGTPFDLSFTVSTGHVNQVLRAQHAVYTGITLGWIDDSVEITGYPSLLPHTVMAREPRPGEAPGKFPVSYQVGQFIVEAHKGADLLARWSVDLHQEDLHFGVDPAEVPTLVVDGSMPDQFTWIPLTTTLPGCTDKPYFVPGGSCLRRATRLVGHVAEPALRELLYGVLQQIPAPKSFGELPVRAEGAPDWWWREGQAITLYADLAP